MAIEPAGAAGDPSPELRDRSSRTWLGMIEEAERYFDKYQTKCDTIDKLYADLDAKASETSDREFAIFWANLEVLKPTIYSRPPVPVVVPRFKDRKELPRQASEVLERCLISSFEADDIDATMRLIRDDLAISSRGQVWCRYEQKPDGYECVHKEHLDRRDFLHQPSRKWAEVEWVARGVWLTRKQGLSRFGEIWLQAEFKEKKDDTDDAKGQMKARAWELWHKGENCVVWVTPGVDDVLDLQPPLFDLEGFFPCPRPAFGTLKRRSLLPVPDFLYYKDQVEEINELTARISSLSESLRLKGFYPGGASDVGEAIEAVLKDQDNRAILVPINSLAAFGSGSLKDSVIWLPVKDVADVIASLIELRRQLIEDVYQITGLSDIMRGETEASETATAQRIKSQYGSIRIRDRQNELVRIARDITRIEAEIMAENFNPQTLVQMSQTDLPSDQDIAQQIAGITSQIQMAAQNPEIRARLAQDPQAQQQAQQMLQQAQGQVQQLQQTITIEKVVGLLKEQRIRPFVLEIETDSTIQPDEDAQKQRATEFITAVGGFMQQSVQAVQLMPEMAPLAAEMLQFTASQFRVGRSVDGAIDEFADKMKQLASQPKPPPPEQVKADAEMKAMQAAADQKKQDAQQAAEADQRKAQLEEQKAKNEADADERQAAIQEQTLALTRDIKRIDLAIARIKLAEAGMEGEADDEGNVTDKSDRMHGETQDGLTRLGEALAQMAQSQAQVNQQLAQGIAELSATVRAPRKLVRGPDGRPAGAVIDTSMMN